jgi:hypothetical protein
MPEMMTTKIHPNLISEQTTSISPNQLTAPGMCQLVVADVRRSTAEMKTHTNVDQNDDNPKDGHPSGDGHGSRPEHQHSVNSLKLVRDRDEVVEPISPTHGEASSRVDEFGRPLHKGGW